VPDTVGEAAVLVDEPGPVPLAAAVSLVAGSDGAARREWLVSAAGRRLEAFTLSATRRHMAKALMRWMGAGPGEGPAVTAGMGRPATDQAPTIVEPVT
jgi:hypothetical protein